MSILRHQLARPTIDGQTLLAAIAAYLMLGMFFAFSLPRHREIQTTPFFGSSGVGTVADDLFFSFVTLTTTGYGNLVPAVNPGQTFAVCEAIVGQLFLVTAVAKIVNESGLLTAPGRTREQGGKAARRAGRRVRSSRGTTGAVARRRTAACRRPAAATAMRCWRRPAGRTRRRPPPPRCAASATRCRCGPITWPSSRVRPITMNGANATA